MRILFIRHGDPDYANDTLTEKGWREASALAARAEALDMGECYVSPLGRAQATAEYSLKKLGKTAETLDWLQEFPAQIDLEQAAHLRPAYQSLRSADIRMQCRYMMMLLKNSTGFWQRGDMSGMEGITEWREKAQRL